MGYYIWHESNLTWFNLNGFKRTLLNSIWGVQLAHPKVRSTWLGLTWSNSTFYESNSSMSNVSSIRLSMMFILSNLAWHGCSLTCTQPKWPTWVGSDSILSITTKDWLTQVSPWVDHIPQAFYFYLG